MHNKAQQDYLKFVNLISKWEFKAWASFLRKATDGLALPDSSLEMTDCLVPIFCANSFWVIPFLTLASRIAWMTANSGCWRSYSAFNTGSFKTSFFQTEKSKCFLSLGLII